LARGTAASLSFGAVVSQLVNKLAASTAVTPSTREVMMFRFIGHLFNRYALKMHEMKYEIAVSAAFYL
jgi:hypothetical protein